MRRVISWTAVIALASAMTFGLQAQSPRPRGGELKVGDAAPGFTLKDVQAKKAVKLSDLKGKPVVLIFGSCT
jgi:cytochrome oxidase Cu insertion factor (SCO1/SenC/PrrC family)